MTDPDFHEIPYDCHFCGRHGRVLGDRTCTVDWLERLHSILVCNPCGDLLDAKNNRLAIVRSIEGRLAAENRLNERGCQTMSSEEKEELRQSFYGHLNRLKDTLRELNSRRRNAADQRPGTRAHPPTNDL